MEQKADASTVEKVTKTVVMIQETIRTEKEARVLREKETRMVKQAMVALIHRTAKFEKEVKVVKEVHDVHHVHHVVKVESQEKIMEVSTKVTEVENAAEAKITTLKLDLKKASAQLAADEAARKDSDAALKTLSLQTMELFKKVASNSEKVQHLDVQLTEKVDALAQSLSEAKVKLMVSAQASHGDTARIQSMLESLSADIAAEAAARKSGDTSMEKIVMGRVQLLIQQMVEVTNKVTKSSSHTHCKCKSTSINGKSATVCTKDGKVVDSCDEAMEGFDSKTITGESAGETSSDEEIEALKSTAPPITTSCSCEMSFKNDKFEEICKKNGEVVPKSECGDMGNDMDMNNFNFDTNTDTNSGSNLDDLMKSMGSSFAQFPTASPDSKEM